MSWMVVTVRLDAVTIKAQNESVHDEPYLWVVCIKVDGETLDIKDFPHSSAIHEPAGSRGDLGPAPRGDGPGRLQPNHTLDLGGPGQSDGWYQVTGKHDWQLRQDEEPVFVGVPGRNAGNLHALT